MNMTPREINEACRFIMKRIEYENEAKDRRTARICSTLVNLNLKKGKKAISEDAFMPKKKKPKKERQQSVKDMNSTVRMLTLMFGGKFKKAGE